MQKRNNKVTVLVKKAVALTLTTTMLLSGTGGLNLWSSLNVLAEDVEPSNELNASNDAPATDDSQSAPKSVSEDLHQTTQLSFHIAWDDEDSQGRFRPGLDALKEDFRSALSAHPLRGKNQSEYDVNQDDLAGKKDAIDVSIHEDESGWNVTYSNVPLFILEGTGNQTTSNGDNTYQVDHYVLYLSGLSIPGYSIHEDLIDFRTRLESPNDVAFISDSPSISISLDTSLFAPAMQRQVTWNDNVDVNGQRPKNLDFLSLHYTVDGSEYAIASSGDAGGDAQGVTTVTAQEAKEALGALDASVFTPDVTRPEVDTHWDLTWKYLPKVANGNTIQYSLYQRQVPEFYLSSLGNGTGVVVDGDVTYTFSDKFSVTVTWNDAAEKDHRLQNLKDLDLSIYQKTASSVKEIYNTKKEVPSGLDDSDIEWPTSYEGNSWTLTVPSLKGYDENNATNTYYVEVKAPNKISGEDWEYEVTYDNGLSSNETGRAYSNGDVLINLKGDTTYQATKVFQVVNLDKEAAASNVTFRLWCYPNNKTADAMSAVTVGGNQLTYKPKAEDIVSCDKGEYKEKGYAQINLNGSCFKQDALDRFDALGYELKYCVTEDPSDQYTVVYPGEANVLENGEVMSNILAHQKIFKVRKIWNTQGYDAFKHTKVTLKLQKSVNGVDWSDADRKAEFSGFTSSVVAKEKSLSPVSKFEDGQELSFRVIEKLTYDGKEVSIDNWTENGQTLSATYRLDGKEYVVTIRRDGDTFTAFNEVSSELTLHLKKVWGNSTSASWGEEDKKEGSKLVRKKRGFSLTVSRAKQGGTPEEYARVNVAVSDEGIEVTAKNKAGEAMDLAKVYQPEVSAEEWDLADLSVPRSDEGYVYDYYVSETFPEMEGAGIYKMVTYRILEQPQDGLDTGDMIATVTNSIYSGTGEYHEIHVKKTWNDNSDVEGRGDVIATIGIWKKNGETWSFEKPSDLLEQGQDIEATLKAGNNYSQIVNVTDLYIPERYKDNSKGAEYATALKDGSDRIRLGVLESGIVYQNQRFASGTGYSYGQKKSDLTGNEAWIAEGVISGGMVNGALRSGYDFTVEEKDGEYTITNTKSGKVEITATIEWKDGGYGKYRQYGWGVALYYVNQNGSDVPFKGEDGQQLVVEDIDSSVTAENAYKTSKEPQKGEDNVNYYRYNDLTFHDLPMYDKKGRLYTYSVHEYIKDKDGQRVELSITNPASDLKKTHYTATGGDDGDLRELTPTLQENVLTQPYEVSFHHKAGGTSVDTTYYTIWYDQARITKPQTYGKRVLAAYKLFYKMSDSSSDTLTKYNQRMVRNTVSAEEGADNNYYQKVMFSGMPEFDDNGNHYEYYAQQQLLNNPSGDAGYTTEYYKKSAVKKNPAVDRTGTPAFDLEDVTIASRCEAGDDPDGVPLPENGLFVNRIHGKLKISGTKEWKDMPDDTKIMGYPDIEVSLKKKSDYDRDDTPIEATINKARSKYHFETTEGEERAFDKFDRYGAPYTYVLTEKMYLPGTKRPINSHLYHSLMNRDTNTENTYDLSGDYVLNNYYSLEGAKRDITIHKSWNENTPKEGHPKATFRLYRSAVDIADMADDDDGGKTTIANILKDAGKLKAYADKKEQVTGFTVGEEENQDVITFDKTESTEEKTVKNLPIYATNGQLYLYFLEEDTMVDSQEGLPGFQPNYSEEDTDYEYKKDMGLVVFKNQNLSTGTASLGDTGKEIETLHISDAVHVENSFDSDTVREITGVKKWAENTVDESSNFKTYVKEKIRPQISNGSLSGVILKLYRALGGETEEISSNQYDLVWSDQDGEYCYSIKPKDGYSFPKYNEDGRAYTYQVVEEMSDTGYVKTNYSGTEKVSKNAASTDDKNVLIMDALTNTLKGGLKVNKWWNDGRDAYLLRDVKLQMDLEAYEEGNNSPVFVMTHMMSKEDKWVYSYKNLPLVNRSGKELTYKIREKTIGSDQVEDLKTQQESGDFKFWGKTKNYQVSYKDYDGLTLTTEHPVASTEITNKLTGTSLDIVKKWEDDSNDFYARPKELRFKLQYRVAKWNESDGKVTEFEGEWQDSQSNASSDNKSVIITMKASDQDKENSTLWKKTVSNLPKTVMVDGSAKFVQYRAVELDQDPDGKDKVLNLNDSMDSYTLTAQNDHENDNNGKDAGNIVSKTELTNTYRPHDAMEVWRLWNDDEAHDTKVALFSANFEKGDKKAEDAGAVVSIVKDGIGKTTERVIAKEEEKVSHVTYENLPKYNRDQKEIHYYAGEVSAAGEAVSYDEPSEMTRTKAKAGNSYRTRYYKISDGKIGKELDDISVTQKGKNSFVKIEENPVLVENTPLIKVSVSKNWRDQNDYKSKGNDSTDRPKKITYLLKKKVGDQEFVLVPEKGEVTVNVTGNTSDQTAAYAWVDLPTHEDVKEGDAIAAAAKIEYSVDEQDLPGYEKTVESNGVNEFTITNTMQMDELTVKKNWVEQDIFAKLRSVESVTFKLMRKTGDDTEYKDVLHTNGSPVEVIVKKDENTKTFENLPRFNSEGKAYKYRAVEVALTYKKQDHETEALTVNAIAGENEEEGVIGYYSYSSQTSEEKNDASGVTTYTTQATNDLKSGSVAVSKDWKDNENQDGKRPEKIQVSLSANEAAGVVIPSESATQVLTKDANWSGVKWTSLPMYDATGRAVAYQVTEARGDEEDSFDSYSNYYKVNGEEEHSGKTATIDLTTSENGKVEFCNKYTPGKVRVDVEKKWLPESVTEKPESVIVSLMKKTDDSHAEFVKSEELSESNGWKTSFQNLSKMQGGKKVIYTVEETPVPGYESRVTYEQGEDEDVIKAVITNTAIESRLVIKKEFTEQAQFFAKNLEDITYKLQCRVADEPWQDVLTSTGEKWTVTYAKEVDFGGTVDGLLAVNKDGKNYEYRAVEEKLHYTTGDVLATSEVTGNHLLIGGFDAEIKSEGDTTTLVNDINGSMSSHLHLYKLWEDGNDQDHKRPTSVVFHIFGKTEEGASPVIDQEITLSSSNKFQKKMNLPVADEMGRSITYVVTEDASSFAEDYPKTMASVKATDKPDTESALLKTEETIEKQVTFVSMAGNVSVTFLNQHPYEKKPSIPSGGGGGGAAPSPAPSEEETPENPETEDPAKDDSKKDDVKDDDSKKDDSKEDDSKEDDSKEDDSSDHGSKKKKDPKKKKDRRKDKDKSKKDSKKDKKSKKDDVTSGEKKSKDKSSIKKKDSGKKGVKEKDSKKKDSKKNDTKKKDSKKNVTEKKNKDVDVKNKNSKKKDSESESSKKKDSVGKTKKKDSKDSGKGKIDTFKKKSSKEDKDKDKKGRTRSVIIKGHYDYKGVWHPEEEVPKTGDQSPLALYLLMAALSFGYLLFGLIHFIILAPDKNSKKRNFR